MRTRLCAALLLALALLRTASAAGAVVGADGAHGARDARAPAPEVVVSIKPLHSLVAGVMRGVGAPQLLIAGAASPHFYSLRPSQVRLLRDADLIVWVGENLESFLRRPIANLGKGARVLTLHEAPGMRLLPNREGGLWGAATDERDAGADAAPQHHGHGAFDTHLWLDPDNARRIVDAVADALARADPARASVYRRNAAALHARIHAQAAALRARLTPLRARGFIVFHDGTHYFENAFGLSATGAITLDPARAPGAGRLRALRRAMRERDVRCLFTEPQFEPDLARTVTRGFTLRTREIDIHGVAQTPGPDAWFQIMQTLGDAFEGCLRDAE